MRKKFKISINDFFSKFGEDKFREIEHQLLLDVINTDNTIISTGGGTPCFYYNIDIINANGISIYLKLNYKSIISRLKQSKKQRPLVKDLNDKEFDEYIEQNLKLREEFYNKAHYIIKSENLTANELIEFIKANIKDYITT